jgi:hypothetical protein
MRKPRDRALARVEIEIAFDPPAPAGLTFRVVYAAHEDECDRRGRKRRRAACQYTPARMLTAVVTTFSTIPPAQTA